MAGTSGKTAEVVPSSPSLQKDGMGTELHPAINLLPPLPGKQAGAVKIRGDPREFWACSREGSLKENIETGLGQLEESMDRLLEQYSRESIRKTILQQEETFRSQVMELHRLYRIQKLLMSELRNKELELARPGDDLQRGPGCREMGFWSAPTSPHESLSPLTSNLHSYTFPQSYHIPAREASSQEPSSSSQDTFRLFDLQRHGDRAVEDQQTALFGRKLKNKMGGEDSQGGDSDVELTLSIGGGMNKRKSQEKTTRTPALSVRADQMEEEQAGLKRPHWLFRALSLNRTR